MKCERCQEPATVHAPLAIEGHKKVVHLCRACAEKGNIVATPGNTGSQLPMVLEQFAGDAGSLTLELPRLVCPDCGTRYMDFRKSGRLGCPRDYSVFRLGLLPLLQRVHRAALHTGKRPRHGSADDVICNQIRHWRYRLRLAVDSEDFEGAAQWRDQIRAKESGHGTR